VPADVTGWALWALGGQIVLQAGVTTVLHLHEVASRRGHAGRHRLLAVAVAGGALAYWAISWFGQSAGQQAPAVFGLNPAEAVYRCFILFYGLVFPAYVWLVMLPTKRAVSFRARVWLWAGVTVLALPAAFVAFVGEVFWLAIPVLGLLLAGRLALAWLPASGDPTAA
jgi:hypothetical protein